MCLSSVQDAERKPDETGECWKVVLTDPDRPEIFHSPFACEQTPFGEWAVAKEEPVKRLEYVVDTSGFHVFASEPDAKEFLENYIPAFQAYRTSHGRRNLRIVKGKYKGVICRGTIFVEDRDPQTLDHFIPVIVVQHQMMERPAA